MKILFQGDSITDAGRGAFGANGLGVGYPIFVTGKLLSAYPANGFEVVNRGISGNRCVDLYQRWKVDCLNMKPDLISILIGVNDTWHEFGSQNGVEPPRYEKVMRELLSWTREVLPDVKLVLCEPFIFSDEQAGEGYSQANNNWAAIEAWRDEVDERRAIIKRLADEFGAVFVPFQEVLNEALKSAPAPHWLIDGVHPTTAGHALLANEWIKAAAPLLGI